MSSANNKIVESLDLRTINYDKFGRVVITDEKLLDAVTGATGIGALSDMLSDWFCKNNWKCKTN